ncbi:hypothetical protein CHI12_17835 [Terribacillus saccharophilus]|uniref:DUF2254 domain-containing protein n=2 Tax=Bacillaceae TaxID=186817 RepID=A0A268H8C4_9BACI|nr:DUF2254 domain-containing protein [Terribacillus saccharophilus]PAD35015.1 hypothetical protein CHH56_11435 [Terribacillus saccharophilus]PAD95727.1 hypothetical protein CHH50_11665 [Terribacillus saccharophilus]PAD99297.1 hypothetical protein CHH48_12565 [Terribacillus saccharophilus]PAE06122.1 hypothetical protein CHI12_17835 [Terribacillus saccharophilus]
MLIKLLPRPLRKYLHMTKRQRKHEAQLNLWMMPTIYIAGTLLLVAIPLLLDLYFDLPTKTTGFFNASASNTGTLVSVLVSGTLLLAAYTLNSILVVLTSFSSEYSPRMLFNFISDRTTQHILGLFYGSFVFMLISFLFVTNSSRDYFTAVPIACTLVTLAAVIGFALFVNHTTTWMQLHNIVDAMKSESERIIQSTLIDELEPYRCDEPGYTFEDYTGYTCKASNSGYIQLINFVDMIKQAKKDDVVIRMDAKAGDFVLKGNRLFSYRGPGAQDVQIEKYSKLIQIGHKRSEIQDVDMSMNKLSEIAIKSIGNDDPTSAINTFHQMADLMINIDASTTLHPYLQDEEEQTRVVYNTVTFSTYLHEGFGRIRHYTQKDYLLIVEMIQVFIRMTDTISEKNFPIIWEFAQDTILHISDSAFFQADRIRLLEYLKQLAEVTGHAKDYYPLERHLQPK